ncbi:hypothetical protein AMJ52_03075 [candidate division TA06 bacterium DG_78]|uniref:Uncharacterized protein n=1 Tax=candidate division TA06 bacterium DG_78 TaxID=1703772 RepID=A0A0S7YGJ9_UNCT6|nr:MAG: hypothetical protein AMJ52_03075 [candidate division TA06 bacterium DG_78]
MTYRCTGRRAYSVLRRAYGVLCFIIAVVLLLTFCDNRIIERATINYFPYEEGNWWRYLGDSDTLLVEVEPSDTLLQTEVTPVSFGGNIKYFVEDDRALSEYVNIVYNFSGDDYTIIENFITRIELPLVYDNVYQDSLIDSLNVFGQWVTAQYRMSGAISEWENTDITEVFDTLYSEAGYKIELVTIYNLTSQDTTITDTTYLEEYYVPNKGLVRFYDGETWYDLIEYEVR